MVNDATGSYDLHLCLVQPLNLNLAYRGPRQLPLNQTLAYHPHGRLLIT